jgi:hypothetical protein
VLPGDEQNFLQFVGQDLSSVLIADLAPGPKPRLIKTPLGSAKKHDELRYILIWNRSFPIQRDDIHKLAMQKYSKKLKDYINTGEVRYFFGDSNAPVIDFSRSFVSKDGKLKQGRIWAAMYRSENGALIRKSADFEAWYDQIARWIRRHGKRIRGVDGYIFQEALEWHGKGGELG